MEGQWFLYPSPDTLYGFSFIWLSFSLAYIASYTFLCSVYWLHRLYLHWPDGARPGTWFPFCVLLLWIHISSASVQAVKGHLGSNSLWHRNHFPWRSIQPVCSTSLITAATLSFSAFSLDQLQLPLASPLSKLGHLLSSLINRTHVLSPLFHSPWPLCKKLAMPNVRASLPWSRRMPAGWLQLSALLLWS